MFKNRTQQPVKTNELSSSVRGPQGFALRDLDFGSQSLRHDSTLEHLGMEDLIGASPFQDANIEANHPEPGVLSGMLRETMQKLEERYHRGVYDAAAVPLVEQYLQEMKHMAHLQAQRSELIAKRVSDIKEANRTAYQALYEVRSKRENEIRETSAFIQEEVRIEEYRKARRRRAKRESRDNKRTLREMRKISRTQTAGQGKITRKDLMQMQNEESAAIKQEIAEEENKTLVAQEKLKQAQALSAMRDADFRSAKAEREKAEQNLARAYLENEEQEVRAQQAAAVQEARQSISSGWQDVRNSIQDNQQQANEQMREMRNLINEQMQQVRTDVADFVKEAKEATDSADEELDITSDAVSDEHNENSRIPRGFMKRIFRRRKSASQEHDDQVLDEENETATDDAVEESASETSEMPAFDGPEAYEPGASETRTSDAHSEANEEQPVSHERA